MRILFISLAVVLLDQFSKLVIKGFSIPFLKIFYRGMFQGESIPVIGNFFRITFIENPGMAFGFDPGFNMKLWLSIFSFVASVGLGIYLYIIREKNFTLRLSIALILGGAIGNLIDRMFYGIFYGYAPLFYGRVVDFLDFDFFKFSLFGKSFDRWPIFNFADASVTIGVLILIIFYRGDQSENKVSQETPSVLNSTEQNGNNA
ncbi:MAG: signal peptidase II [Ignavibacteriaceae bacterium]